MKMKGGDRFRLLWMLPVWLGCTSALLTSTGAAQEVFVAAELKTDTTAKPVTGVLMAVTDTGFVLPNARTEQAVLWREVVRLTTGIEPSPSPSWIAIGVGSVVGIGATLILTPISDETNRERNQPTGVDALFVSGGAMLGAAIGAGASYLVSAASVKQQRQYRRIEWQALTQTERTDFVKELKHTLERQ